MSVIHCTCGLGVGMLAVYMYMSIQHLKCVCVRGFIVFINTYSTVCRHYTCMYMYTHVCHLQLYLISVPMCTFRFP